MTMWYIFEQFVTSHGVLMTYYIFYVIPVKSEDVMFEALIRAMISDTFYR